MTPFHRADAPIAAESHQLSGSLQCACLQHDGDTLLVACSGKGLVMLEFVDRPLSDDRIARLVRERFPDCTASICAMTVEQVAALPLHLVGTAFQCRVWRALLTLAPGEVCHYQDIAAHIGSGARAVGSAVARNRIAMMIPCHRVVPSAGGTGQYRWGAQRKARLLEQESARRVA